MSETLIEQYAKRLGIYDPETLGYVSFFHCIIDRIDSFVPIHSTENQKNYYV